MLATLINATNHAVESHNNIIIIIGDKEEEFPDCVRDDIGEYADKGEIET